MDDVEKKFPKKEKEEDLTGELGGGGIVAAESKAGAFEENDGD